MEGKSNSYKTYVLIKVTSSVTVKTTEKSMEKTRNRF